ncbi:hypothetical protein [Sphingomonas sp. OK281]|uniref:hypothetical protein n=1 Tax=Sphingomonas sp. OK281 TaxID=1881067 RepID=UPI0008F3C745|nr:hypothetical protein [Sphingomonas sp. OK281]SFO08122.1 hypothetical protein SAMN05428984_2122 [Sphingomonas sp. OK281]
MRMRTLPLLMLPAVLLGACTQTQAEVERAQVHEAGVQDKLAKELAGLVPGKPETCINQFTQKQSSGYGPTILYRVSRRLVYRTETAGGCEGIARGDILVTRTPSGQLCRGDIAQTLDQSSRFPTGSCSFGAFVPYRKP